MRYVLPFAVMAISACSAAPTGSVPSLAPRAAEKIDPRVPVGGGEAAVGPADPALAVVLAAAVAKAQGGEALFAARLAEAEQAAARAGKPHGEEWIAAQEALSALVAAADPAATAAADIDAEVQARVAAHGDLARADHRAITAAATTVDTIRDAQSAAVARLTAQLGS